MKYILRTTLLVALILTAFLFVPSASALDHPGIMFYNAHWSVPCGGLDGGAGEGSLSADVWQPIGYRQEWSFYQYDPDGETFSLGGVYTPENADDIWSGPWITPYWVPAHGYVEQTVKIFSPEGDLLTTTYFQFNCITGEAITRFGDVYTNIRQPGADERASGTVLVDTPLYSSPDPAAVREEVLKAGQTWFVVGQVTGTDGKLWYEVFVGGPNNAFVPASTIQLLGPLP